MTTTKKREKFFLWLEQYTKFKSKASKKGISASELLVEAVSTFKEPEERPLRPRVFTVDEKIDTEIQKIADKWFSPPDRNVPGNRSDAVAYIIEQYLKRASDD
jgi:hypothetical protein